MPVSCLVTCVLTFLVWSCLGALFWLLPRACFAGQDPSLTQYVYCHVCSTSSGNYVFPLYTALWQANNSFWRGATCFCYFRLPLPSSASYCNSRQSLAKRKKNSSFNRQGPRQLQLPFTFSIASASIGPSEPMQNDQTCFFSNIFLKFYNIINNNLKL